MPIDAHQLVAAGRLRAQHLGVLKLGGRGADHRLLIRVERGEGRLHRSVRRTEALAHPEHATLGDDHALLLQLLLVAHRDKDRRQLLAVLLDRAVTLANRHLVVLDRVVQVGDLGLQAVHLLGELGDGGLLV